MKNRVFNTIIFFLFITSADGQKNLFINLDTANFNYPDYVLMQKHGYESYSIYEFVKDSMIFKEKVVLNYDDSTMSIIHISKRNKPKSNVIPMYDDLAFSVNSDTACCPYRENEYDSLNRIIKSTQSFPYSINKLKIIDHYIYVDTTHFLKFVITENILHDLYVNSTVIIEYDYRNILIGFERKIFITERDYQPLSKTHLNRFSRINNEGLLIYEMIYDKNGNVVNQYKYTYE